MSYRIQVISNAFEKDAAASADRSIGQLMRVTNAGKATNVLGESNLLFLPLIQPFKFADDQVAELQVSGIAKVAVETFTSILGGSPLARGATGIGVKIAVATEIVIGYALETPTSNGQLIAVLLAPGKLET